jgi:nucleoside-diphosphate-sugar epimerase
MNEGASGGRSEINHITTKRFAEEAATAGVKHFIFIGSVKVEGEKTGLNQLCSKEDAPNPSGQYGISEENAEQAMKAICLNLLEPSATRMQ